jgi:ankyrin repeat protein
MFALINFIRVFLLSAVLILVGCSLSTSDSVSPGNKPNPPGPVDPNENPEYELSINSNDCLRMMPDNDLQRQLKMDIDFGEASCVKRDLELGARADLRLPRMGFDDAESPIFYALDRSKLWHLKNKSPEFAVLKVLVEGGASLTVKNDQGLSPLRYALTQDSILSDYPLVPGYMIFSGKADLTEIDSQGLTLLHLTLSLGSETLTRQLIFKGIDINAMTRLGESPLQLAINKKLEDTAVLLVDRGAQVTGLDRNRNTVLHLAINKQLSKFFGKVIPLVSTTLLNTQNTDFETPLFAAVKANSVEMVRQLLAAGADAEVSDQNESPLHLALRKEYSLLTDLLLAKIKNFEAKDKEGRPLIFLAIKNKNMAVTNSLLSKRVDVSYKDTQGSTLLHWALMQKLHSIIDSLIDLGIAIDAVNSNQETALYTAVEVDDLIGFKALVNHGANTDVVINGSTALLYALAAEKSGEMIDILIDRTRNVNAQNTNGETALFLAIAQGSVAQAERLLARGANPEIATNDLRSPLGEAVKQDQIELAKTLIQKGARADRRDKNGQNLMHEAKSESMAQVLVQAKVAFDELDANGDSPLSLAVRNGRFPLVRFFVSQGANINWRSAKKETLVHVAVQENESNILLYLVELGIDVNAKDSEGQTALFDVSIEGILDILVRSGADVNSTNKKGISLLAVFIDGYKEYPYQNDLNLIEKLLRYRANPNVKDSDGELLLHAVVYFRPPGDRHLSRVKPAVFDASQLLKLFLEAESLSLELKDINDETAMHKVDTSEEASLLITAGADLNPINKDKKQTPLGKKQAELESWHQKQNRLKDEIAANEELKRSAESHGDHATVRRLEKLLMEQNAQLPYFDGEIVAAKSVIATIAEHGGR